MSDQGRVVQGCGLPSFALLGPAAAASDLFKGQPIPEIGSETWGQMLRYARDFALEVFPDGEPPQISTAGRCVLCQQELDGDASARLRAFDEYLEDRAAADAAAAKTAFEQAAALISNYSIKSKEEVSTLLAGFSALDDDRKVLAEKIVGYFEKANARLTLLKKALDEQDYTKFEGPQPLPESLVDLISADETKLSEESEEFDSLAHARSTLGRWRHDYNHIRPHSSLGGLTPAARRSLELDGSTAPDPLAKPQTMDYGKARLSL